MKKLSVVMILLFTLSLLLTACTESEKNLSFTCATDPGEYRPGDTVAIVVYVENKGPEFQYVGAIQDQFQGQELSINSGDSEYSITYKWVVTTDDATKRQFKPGEMASHTFHFAIPQDALPGKYVLTFWAFGQKAEIENAVTILPAEDPIGPTVDADAQLTAGKAEAIENAWYNTMGVTLGSWCVEGEDTFTDGVRYYGNYGGFEIIFRPTGDDAISQLEVENTTFFHRNGFEIFAYQDGKFTPLQELYARGLLTQTDLIVLGVKHESYELRLNELLPPSNFGNLDSSEAVELMKQAFLTKYAPDGEYSVKDLTVTYYGAYSGAHVGFVDGIFMYPQAVTTENIDGVIFRYRSGQKLEVYFEGELMGVPEAYERGILTRDDLVAISNILNPKQDDAAIK